MLLSFLKDPSRLARAGDKARDLRDWKAAVHAYQRYLRRRPRDVAILIQYGHALKELGQFHRASEAYHAALALAPLDADLHLQIGHLNKVTGNGAAALGMYRRALELDPTLQNAQAEIDSVISFGERHLSEQWRQSIEDAVRRIEWRLSVLEKSLMTSPQGTAIAMRSGSNPTFVGTDGVADDARNCQA